MIVGLQILGQGEAHTKGRKVIPSPSILVSGNEVEFIERQFIKWVDWVGTLKHSMFKTTQNKLLPSFYITVDKTLGVGDFSSVKQALDSLPLINLARVVIEINPGIYMEEIAIPATKAFITVEGGGADNTVIQWGDTANTPGLIR